MTRTFETSEITKLLDVLIGKTEAVGETNEDERRLDNLKTLIDVTNWCLDGLQFAMASGYGRAEYSMAEISYTAQCALDEYGRWIADILDEQMADRKTEPTISKMEQVDKDINVRSKDERQAKGIWNAGYKTGYDKGYKDAQKVKDSQDLVKNLVKAFCEDGTWLERQGVYTLTLAEAKQRAVDIIESVLAKYEPTTQTETQNSNLTFEKVDEPQTEEHCETCKHKDECDGATYEYKNTEWWCLGYAPIDEPQTELVRVKYHCINCAENGSYKCSKCDGEMYFKDEPQTDCPFGEDDKCFGCGDNTKCVVFDEPQTERSE